MICLDPQGGCELGPGGVVDEMFRVHGTDNLYVADASLFPTSVGLNPMVPVMALGELLATTLLK
jgi:choline dehydrogenase-like flavoprotein